MANKMLIDATHPEETRVVVLRGNRVEEFDFETAHRKQLRGNIYLAKVTRVEPSLQAAFIDYGGNRHGFLAFSEIHPDYYQIPVADRQALIEADAREAREHDSEDDRGNGRRNRGRNRHRERPHARRTQTVQSDPLAAPESPQGPADITAGETMPGDPSGGHGDDISAAEVAQQNEAHADDVHHDDHSHDDDHHDHEHDDHGHDEHPHEVSAPFAEAENPPVAAEGAAPIPATHAEFEAPSSEIPADVPFEAAPLAESETPHTEDAVAPASESDGNGHSGHGAEEEEEIVESVGGSDALEEAADRAPRFRRQYKIQEVIKRRQVMLVQVVKEERGTKGAALTTYLSLAGRYCVLMPNTARGGGISRKITSADDRKKLREIAEELEVPEGMGVILRTAGAARTKAEVKRDFEYLLRQWELVRDLTLKSTAPTLVYEEGSLAKRSIRDLYAKDIDEIVVAGEGGFRDAKDFMRMLMPSHAKNVKHYKDTQPIFTRYGIENQLDAMFSPTVQLRSGGYIVLNQTEALVSIDVNSGRSTREHHIEDTALKTNVEASEEIARQLRLRDLAGLIVIDYIDMDEKRNNRTVERRLKDALRNDRARIQVGRISHFGLMEMSRQRIRTSVLESSTEKCPHCGGTGHVRSVSSVALQLLRSVEEMLLKGPTHNLIVRTRPEIALYVLNHKRAHLRGLEERFRVTLTVNSDEEVGGQTGFVIDRGDQVMTLEQAKTLVAQAEVPPLLVEEDEPESADAGQDEEENDENTETFDSPSGAEDGLHTEAPHESDTEDEAGREGGRDGRGRRRRRRGRGRGGRNGEDRGPGLGRDQEPNGLQPHGSEPHGSEPRAFEPGEPMHDDQPPAFTGGGEFASSEGAPPQDREPRPQSEDGDPRRRRRGRRGGRRNRRDRDENFNVAGPQGHESPENQENSPHLDRPAGNDPSRWNEPQPIVDVSEPMLSEPTPRIEHTPPPQPAPQPAALAAPAAPTAEPPRRRSTVREPAPTFSGSSAVVTPMPALQPPPAPIATEADEASKPRRTGWWAKRLLGGDKG